jgi:Zn-dependent protease
MLFIMKFSEIEKHHLLKAWVAISLAFAILMADIFSISFVLYFFISLFTVGIGFLLHELAHKLVAQRYGCFAEFRADDRMLIFSILSAFLGFIFAAPGAVLIFGHVTKEKNGKISIAGPATNIFLAILFFVLKFFFRSQYILSEIFDYGFQINSFIALFNMIPFMNFDGQKIWSWNKPVYILAVIISGALVLLSKFFIFQ